MAVDRLLVKLCIGPELGLVIVECLHLENEATLGGRGGLRPACMAVAS